MNTNMSYDSFQKSLHHLCALDESSLSIGRVSVDIPHTSTHINSDGFPPFVLFGNVYYTLYVTPLTTLGTDRRQYTKTILEISTSDISKASLS